MALTNWQKTFLSSIRTARAAIPEGCAFKEEAELIFAQLTIGVTAPSMPAAERRNRTAAPAKPAAAAKVPQPARARGRTPVLAEGSLAPAPNAPRASPTPAVTMARIAAIPMSTRSFTWACLPGPID